jgi:hypothetical protein
VSKDQFEAVWTVAAWLLLDLSGSGHGSGAIEDCMLTGRLLPYERPRIWKEM